MSKKSPKLRYNVILTSEATEQLSHDPLKIFLRYRSDGRAFFTCYSFESDYPFLQMLAVENAPEDKAWEMKIWIPQAQVAYILGSTEEKSLGFLLKGRLNK